MTTFGVTADNSSSTSSSADRKRVSSASPSSDGTVQSLTARLWVDSGSTVAKAVIYSNNAGQPDHILATSDELTISNTTGQAKTSTFSGANQISVTDGTTYWIDVIVQDPGAANWIISRDGTANGNKNNADTYSDGPASGYAKTWHQGKRIRLHRLILNAPSGVKVDHRDHDKLNNQKSNLRVRTTNQNNQNGALRKDNTSGYKGVSLEKSTGRWRPLVYADGETHYVGQFKDKHYAALAYDLWATDLHGEFAASNFPVVSFGP